MHPSDLWGGTTTTTFPCPLTTSSAAPRSTPARSAVDHLPRRDPPGTGKKTTQVIVEMPQDAPTKSCDEDRHHQCAHRRGGPHEGGIWLKVTRPLFLWRCGCYCHSDPQRTGMLF